jgi:hypothetical protein
MVCVGDGGLLYMLTTLNQHITFVFERYKAIDPFDL